MKHELTCEHFESGCLSIVSDSAAAISACSIEEHLSKYSDVGRDPHQNCSQNKYVVALMDVCKCFGQK